ncbi:sodium:proton antiporter [Oxalobacteraceae bacterium OM1]|nr:sodium:proton antiporter [Oxalobacteraceae bacterium OM1]
MPCRQSGIALFSTTWEAYIEAATIWYLLIGALLILMGLMGSILEKLPLSPAMLYLAIGFALGPSGLGLVRLDPFGNAKLLTLLTEIALLISLFAVGLRLRVSLSDSLWKLPWRLGVLGMLVTIGLVTVAGVYLLHLPLGAAVLLGAMLAPTDPVLASDVQVQDVGDRDRIRFSLSGEGGLNDGTAYPFVMLGLFLLGVPEAGDFASAKGIVLAAWGVLAGLGIGWALGRMVVRLALYLRLHYKQALGMEEFFALGLIAVSYGVAHAVHGIGFVAVFAAGVAMRRIEHQTSGAAPPEEVIGKVHANEETEVATHPVKAPAYMTETVMAFNGQLEHIVEFVMVLLTGIILSGSGMSREGFQIGVLLLLVIRPLAAGLSLAGAPITRVQRRLMSWFGIRGIGSLYYLLFVLQYHWDPQLMQRFVPLVLTAVTVSIVAHGISATPLMEWYYRRNQSQNP